MQVRRKERYSDFKKGDKVRVIVKQERSIFKIGETGTVIRTADYGDSIMVDFDTNPNCMWVHHFILEKI
jgi:hypothetical protein